jgi:hypothetical protein
MACVTPEKSCLVRDILSKNTVDTVAGDAYIDQRKEVISMAKKAKKAVKKAAKKKGGKKAAKKKAKK